MSRILIATDAWRPQINGVVRTLERINSELQGAGHETIMITPQDFKRLPLPGYAEIELALPSMSKILRQIREARPDYIHIATEGPIGWIVRRACAKLCYRFSTSYHTRFPEYLAARLPVPTRLTYAVLRAFHNRGDATLVATQSLAQELAGRGFSRIRPWTRGVDLSRFSPAKKIDLPLQRPIFLYVGRLAPEKSIEDFLSLGLPGTKLVVGDGPARAKLEQAFPDAIFTGALEGDELAGYYVAADVFVFPSRTDTFGLVVLEALASGTPVAALPVAGPQDILADTGAGVIDDNLQVAAMAALSVAPARCVALASRYSWKTSAAMFLEGLVPIGGDEAATQKSAADREDRQPAYA